MSWQETLSELVLVNSVHGRFLNMLSLMEYIGARKIVKSQLEKDIKPDVLAHMSEEIRHAQIFKSLALKIDPQLTTYDDYHIVAGAQARGYMQSIDRGVESLLGVGKPWENYLLSTLIIEERARTVYPFYASLLGPLGLDRQLKAIVREEEKHLEDIEKYLSEKSTLNKDQLHVLRRIEEQSFNGIIDEVQKVINYEKSLNETVLSH